MTLHHATSSTCHSHNKQKIHRKNTAYSSVTGLQGGKRWLVSNPVGWYLVNGIIWGSSVSVVTSPLLQMNMGTPFSITISITMIQFTWHGPKIRGKPVEKTLNIFQLSLFTCKLTVTLHSNLDDCIDPRRSTLGLAPKKPRTPPTLATSAWVAPLMVVFLGAAS